MIRSIVLASSIVGLFACAQSQPAAAPPPSPASSATLTSAEVQSARPAANPFNEPSASPQPTEWSQPVVPVAQWGAHFPDAAIVLGQWIQAHPDTAGLLADFQEKSPVKMKALVDWSVSDEGDPVGVFLMNRWGWDDLRAIATHDPDGLKTFLGWVRSAPTAATNLSWQPAAMRFAVEHADILAASNPEKAMAKHPFPVNWHPADWQPTPEGTAP